MMTWVSTAGAVARWGQSQGPKPKMTVQRLREEPGAWMTVFTFAVVCHGNG